MKYELAKELKEKGFPYRTIWIDDVWDAPTLSELIEACGEDFHALRVYHEPKVQWTALAKEYPDQEDGSTPEEAVAKLWIALQK